MTKDKEMINTNKAVVVKFAQHTNDLQLNQTGEANIYIPFPVKEIYLRGVDLDFNADFQVMYFTSSLVDNNTIGSGYAGVMYDNSTTTKQLHYIFEVHVMLMEPTDLHIISSMISPFTLPMVILLVKVFQMTKHWPVEQQIRTLQKEHRREV